MESGEISIEVPRIRENLFFLNFFYLKSKNDGQWLYYLVNYIKKGNQNAKESILIYRLKFTL